ncbi:MAG: hypothetical protein WAO91_03040 [Candidatus Nitrosotenuis sp.]
MTPWGLIVKSVIIVGVLLFAKIVVVDFFELDVISVNPVVTAIVAGVIFTIAIIFTGTLSDYKESEKIPGDLAASLKSLYKDSLIINNENNGMQKHVKILVSIINSNFVDKDSWKTNDINKSIDSIEEDVRILMEKGLPPQWAIKLRNDLSNIERISNRIETIIETSFMPAAYTIAQIAIGLAIGTLLFVGLDPYYEGIALFGGVSFLLISLLLLIKDMDNPFTGDARVDLKILYKLEEYLKAK